MSIVVLFSRCLYKYNHTVPTYFYPVTASNLISSNLYLRSSKVGDRSKDITLAISVLTNKPYHISKMLRKNSARKHLQSMLLTLLHQSSTIYLLSVFINSCPQNLAPTVHATASHNVIFMITIWTQRRWSTRLKWTILQFCKQLCYFCLSFCKILPPNPQEILINPNAHVCK